MARLNNKNLWIALMMQHKMLISLRKLPMAEADRDAYLEALIVSGEALNAERENIISSGECTRAELADIFAEPVKQNKQRNT